MVQASSVPRAAGRRYERSLASARSATIRGKCSSMYARSRAPRAVRAALAGAFEERTPEGTLATIARADAATTQSAKHAILQEQSLVATPSPLVRLMKNPFRQHATEEMHTIREGTIPVVFAATCEVITDITSLEERYETVPNDFRVASLGEAGATNRPTTTADAWVTIAVVCDTFFFCS